MSPNFDALYALGCDRGKFDWAGFVCGVGESKREREEVQKGRVSLREGGKEEEKMDVWRSLELGPFFWRKEAKA